MTYDDIVNLIYSVDAETRQKSVFTCGHEVFRDLRNLHDDDGRYLIDTPMAKNEPYRLMGYPLFERADCGDLAFGPEAGGMPIGGL